MPDRPPGQRLLIQIDGLSRPELDRAIEEGDAPTLAGLAGRDDMTLISVYSGLPSTTPAVQGELFYGVRTAVPGFAYLENRTTARHMLDPASASHIEKELEKDHTGLLEGGASYCNIYLGGADIARFTPSGMARPTKALARGVRFHLRQAAGYTGVGLRTIAMVFGEAARFVADRGLPGRRTIMKRLDDTWKRIFSSVVLRDSSRLAALHDLREGRPVVAVNFVGYDKLAHRYGPKSPPARRALKGIDGAISSLVPVLEESDDAVLVVYSDHGQEDAIPIRRAAGERIEAIIREAVEAEPARGRESDNAGPGEGRQSLREEISETIGEEVLGVEAVRETDSTGRAFTTVESGPIAHVYIEDAHQGDRLSRIARRVAARLEHVAAFFKDPDGHALGCLGDEDPVPVERLRDRLGDHPFADAVTQDLGALLDHKDAGDLVLMGAGFGERPITFANERGAHGGTGPLETHAFAIAPRRLGLDAVGSPVRFENIREALLRENDREERAS